MSSSLPPTTSTGASAPLQDEHDALPVGTRLAEFEILRVLGVGGFGIVYLAMDHALDRLVAVKEYMPSMMAARGRGTEVSVRSSMHQDTFNIGLRSFVNEAKLLARFNHASLVKVYRFWEANGTAYMAMPFYPGRTLKEERRAMLEVPNETWLRGLVDPLLGAMEVLHKESVYHRDIAPDNILLLPDGPPVLLDFGAARAVIGDRTQSLTAVLKPSYAPIEQYADVGHLRQGPWTDLYALGAVLHFVVTGRPPTPSASRAVHDDQKPLTSLGREHTGSMPLKVLKAIDWALTVSPHTRPQNVQQFRDALEGRFEPPQPVAKPAPTVDVEPTRAAPSGWDRTQRSLPEPAAPVDLELTVVGQPATGHDVPTQPLAPATSPAVVPPVNPPPVNPPQAPPASPNPPPSAAPPRTSRALPPLFEVEAEKAAPAARSRVGLVPKVIAAVVLVAQCIVGYVLLKDRFNSPAAPVVSAPASAPAPVPVILAPTAPSLSTAPQPVPVSTTPVGIPTIAVPNWAASAVVPAPPPVPASAVAVAASAVPASRVATPATPRPKPKPPTTAGTAAPAPTPRDTCNARDTGSMSSCMRRLCTQGPMVDHAQCVQLRREEEW